MIKYLKITNTAMIAFFIVLLLTFLASVIHAQESPEDLAKKYNVSFPVAELGNCSSYTECRSFCEDPVNATTCINFAKSKGFYQEDPVVSQKDKILGEAKRALGCDSFEACSNFCEVPANHDKCDSFAKSQGITGGHVDDPSKREIVARAQQVLGCSSSDSCKSFCEQEANRARCSDFAKQVGLRGGEHLVGPGGCTSESTCKSFCSEPNNYQICKGFHDVGGGQFVGPGGCNSEASCRTYCQQNEAECSKAFGGPVGGPGASPPPGYIQEMCNRTPNCSWAGTHCQCGYYGETEETAKKAGEYAAFCRNNPDKCKPPTGGPTVTSDPATECAKYGCTWSNNSCQCTNIQPVTPPPPSGTTPPPGYTPPSSYTPPPGYTPPSSYTPPPGYTPPSSYTPPPPSGSTPPPPPPPSSSYEPPPPPPPPSGYTQGVATTRGLLQQLLDWIEGR